MTFTKQFSSKLAVAVALLSAGTAMAQVACGASTTLTPAPEYTLTFQVCGDSLVGSVSAVASGWVAFGFGRDQTMPDTDVFMAGLSGGVPYSQDALALMRSPPTRDAIQNVTFLNPSEVGGVTSYSFSRLLNTGDTAGDFDLTDGEYFVFMAYHATSDSLTNRHTFRDVSGEAFTFAPVPEPGSILLMAAGLALVASRLRQR